MVTRTESASPGRTGLSHLILGSVAEKVIRQAHCPVITVRASGAAAKVTPYLNILVPFDFSSHAEKALLYAWSLAKLIAIVPISLAGLGVREASLAVLMTPLGADPAKVVAVGLMWQVVLFAAGMLGGIMLLLTARTKGVAGEASGTFNDPLSTQHLARRDG